MKKWCFELKPELPEKVLDAVLSDVPKNEALICCAVQTPLRYNGSLIKNGIFVATPNFALAFKKTLGRYVRLCLHHVVHMTAFIVSKESEGFLIRGKYTNLIVISPQHLKISRILFRNFSCITKGISGKQKPEIAAYSDALYPPFTFNISPGQEFQFLYNAYASLYEWFPDVCVVHRIHEQFKLLNFAFNLPTYHKSGKKRLTPIYKAAACLPYFTSFFSNLETDDDPIEGLRFFVKYSTEIRYVNVTALGEGTDFKNIIRSLEKHDLPLHVRAWRIAGKSFVNTGRFMTNVMKRTKVDVKMLDFSGMSMSKDALLIMLKGLTKDHFHSVEYLGFGYVREAGMNCVAAFRKYIDELMLKKRFNLKILAIPGMKKSRHYVRVLQATGYPIEKLNIGFHKLNEKGRSDVIEFVSSCESLKELDLSGTKIPADDAAEVIRAIANCKNENLFVLKMSSNRFGKKIADVLSAILDSKPEKWRGFAFDENRLAAGSLKILISVVSKLPNLCKLSISRNFSSSMRDIGKNIAQLLKSTSLTSLRIRGGVKGKLKEEALPIIEALKFNQTLEKLDISSNGIGSAGVDLLAQALTLNKKLRWLQCDNSAMTSMSCLENLIRAFKSRPESMHLPFPDTDASVLYQRSRARDAAGRQIVELETQLMFNLALHRRGTKWDRLPVACGTIPYKEIIREASYEIEELPEMQMRNIHSCVSTYFGLALPFQWVKDSPKYGEENIDVDDDKLDVYEMPNLKIMVREADNTEDYAIDPRTRFDLYFPTIVPGNVLRQEEEEKNEEVQDESSSSNSSDQNNEGDEYKERRKLNYAFDTMAGGESQPKRAGRVRAPAMVMGKAQQLSDSDSDSEPRKRAVKGARKSVESESSEEGSFKGKRRNEQSSNSRNGSRRRIKLVLSDDSDERPVPRKSNRRRADSDSDETPAPRKRRRQTQSDSDSDDRPSRRKSRSPAKESNKKSTRRARSDSESESDERPAGRARRIRESESYDSAQRRPQRRGRQSDSDDEPVPRHSRRQIPSSDSDDLPASRRAPWRRNESSSDEIPQRRRLQVRSESDSDEVPAWRRNKGRQRQEDVDRQPQRRSRRTESDSDDLPMPRRQSRPQKYRTDSDDEPVPRRATRVQRHETDSDELPPPRKSQRPQRYETNSDDEPPPRKPKRPQRYESDSDDEPPPRKSKRPQRYEPESDDDPPPRKSKRPQRYETDSDDEPPPRKPKRPQRYETDSDEDPPPRKSKRPQRYETDSDDDPRMRRKRSKHVAFMLPK